MNKNSLVYLTTSTSKRVLAMSMTSTIVTYLFETFVLDYEYFIPTGTLHLGVGVACLSIVFAPIYEYERLFLQEIITFRTRNQLTCPFTCKICNKYK